MMGNLNMRQLLNPIFFSVERKHPDSKRQRTAKLRSNALWDARVLKATRSTVNLPLTETALRMMENERRCNYEHY